MNALSLSLYMQSYIQSNNQPNGFLDAGTKLIGRLATQGMREYVVEYGQAMDEWRWV